MKMATLSCDWTCARCGATPGAVTDVDKAPGSVENGPALVNIVSDKLQRQKCEQKNGARSTGNLSNVQMKRTTFALGKYTEF